MNLFDFIPGYTSGVYDTGREPALIMLLAFVITFLLTRGYTRLARVHGWGSASFGGVHTHHLVFGLVIAFTAAAAEFAFSPEEGVVRLLLAAAFGTGAALVLDEFALVFHLEDVYWEREGRKSVDAVVLGLAFGFLFMLQSNPFAGPTEDVPYLAFLAVLFVNWVFVIIAALKGKIFLAIFGLFIPLLAQIGGIRLAEPDSIWARKFYKPNSKKMKKTIKRYERYERIWRPRKEKAWDLIGGKPGRPLRKP